MDYCILDGSGIVENIIVVDEKTAQAEILENPAYPGVCIGDLYKPTASNSDKDAKQEQNKAALAQWLADHPLTWTDGKQYGVEEQDQNEMALNLMQYQAAQLASQVAPLEWHAQKEACREFTQEEYIGLSMAISSYVYPYRRYQESIKEAIYAAETQEELDAIVIDYSSVSNE